MSENLSSEIPNDPFVHVSKRISTRTKTQVRGTYTEPNALIFKGIFDAIIQSDYTQERLVKYEGLDVAPYTMYIKINDGLKWWVNNEQTPDGPYHLLRELYYFKRTNAGIIVKRNLKKIQEVKSEIATGLNKDRSIISFVITDIQTGADVTSESPELKASSMQKEKTWKDVILDVFENGKFGVNIPITLSNPLSSGDIQWLDNLFSGATEYGIDYALEGNTITIRKEKI